MMERVEILVDSLGVKQHHWNTGAKENHQLNPGRLGVRNEMLWLTRSNE